MDRDDRQEVGNPYDVSKRYSVGVIIPLFNCRNYLRKAVESVLRQPCDDVCVIIVDDGSTDGSSTVAAELAANNDRVIVISLENSGTSTARNTGIEAALSMHIGLLAFLDSDDAWVEGFFSSELRDYLLSENADVYSFSCYFTNEKMTRGLYVAPLPYDPQTGRFDRYGGHFSSYLYNAEVFRKYGVRFPKGILYQEDKSFEYLFFSVCKTSRIVPRPIFKYRSNSKSLLHRKLDMENLYFYNVIPAWHFVRGELERLYEKADTITETDFSVCFTMQKTFLAEFIEKACESGMRPRRINAIISKSGLSTLFDRDDVWVDSKRKKLWEDYHSHPMLFFVLHRVKGIGFSALRRTRNFALVQRIRYPIVL